MAAVFCNLPWPPSANTIWRSTGAGVVLKSAAYRLFCSAVNDYVLERCIPRHWTSDRLAVGLLCCPPDRKTIDIDNRVKPTLDALVGAGVIADDSMVDIIVVVRGCIVPSGSIHVRIEELSKMDPARDVRQWLQMDADQLYAHTPTMPVRKAALRWSRRVR